jgi:chromosome segregation ATPase
MYCTDTSSSQSGSSNAAVLSLTKEVEKAKEKAEQQEVKLKQAAEFISYQEEQISTLTKDVEELNTQLESSSVKRWVICPGCSYIFCFQATSLLLVLTH